MKIVYLPGDGVGPEVTAAARLVMAKSAEAYNVSFSEEEALFGGIAIDKAGEPLPAATEQACLSADAVFLGAVGGPKWDLAEKRPEQGLLALRKSLGVYANLRPTTMTPGLEDLSPLKHDRVSGTDFLIIRELTGGLYFGEKKEGDESASDLCTYSNAEVTRIARIAFDAARKRRGKVSSVDKANVLATSRLWRKTVIALHQEEYSDVALDHVLVDAMAMKLIQAPTEFDVILTENLFGDILSDEASVLGGSIGVAPSASLGDGVRGLYEPIHGSAPDIAGQGKANPIGAILSAAMMCRFSLGAGEMAAAIESAVERTIADGLTTPDIGGSLSTMAVAEAVADRVQAPAS